MTENPTPLASPTSLGAKLSLRVTSSDEVDLRQCDVSLPFAVVGRSSHADVRLVGSQVSYRHAYLQTLPDGVFCVDLGSKAGLYWGKRRREFGWMKPDEPLRIGPFRVALAPAGDPAGQPAAPPKKPEIPLKVDPQTLQRGPHFVLRVQNGSGPLVRAPVSRTLTLIGRWNACSLCLPSHSVSRVHCSLVQTPEGLWVVDLLGRGGTLVNDEVTRYARLQHGDLLRIGRYSIRVVQEEAVAPAPSAPARPTASTRKKSSALSKTAPQETPAPAATAKEETPAPPVAVQEPAGAAAAAEPIAGATSDEAAPHEAATEHSAFEWMGTLFHIERETDTLIVIPEITSGFRYAKLQAEANALRRKLDDPVIHNLVVDLQGLGYIGSEVIGVVVSLARKTTDRGGTAVLCRASHNVKEVLQNMGLLRLWQHFDSRDDALSAVSKS